MKYWLLWVMLPTFFFGYYLGTLSWDSQKTVKAFTSMRFPADLGSTGGGLFSVKEIAEEDIGSGNFLFNARLVKNENSWGITSKNFYVEKDDDLQEVCDLVNSEGGQVHYVLEAQNVAVEGDKLQMKVSHNCDGFDFIELFPFNFCEPEFKGFTEEVLVTDSGVKISFANFSDFMPKSWFLREVVFDYGISFPPDIVMYNPAEAIVLSCFEN